MIHMLSWFAGRADVGQGENGDIIQVIVGWCIGISSSGEQGVVV